MCRLLPVRAMVLGAMMSACSPALDWREVRPADSGVTALFPCKPKSQVRAATLAGAATPMTLHSCRAEGLNFALSHAELGDPSRVVPALRQLGDALASNIGADEVRSAPLDLAGMTPDPNAKQLWLVGRLPDGTAAHERAALFALHTRVYQVVVLGTPMDDAAADTFFDNLRVSP